MKIAVIGAGKMGAALATRFVLAGHDVTIGFGRDPARIDAAAATSGATARHDLAAAAADADMVLVCGPPDAIDDALAATGPLAGKIVVSVSSGLALDPTGRQVGKAPGARVVQAFTATFADMLGIGGGGGPVRATLPLAGDDSDAVAVVGALIAEIGFAPLPVGGLVAARALETLATAFAQFAIAAKLAPLSGLHVVGAALKLPT